MTGYDLLNMEEMQDGATNLSVKGVRLIELDSLKQIFTYETRMQEPSQKEMHKTCGFHREWSK